MTAGAFDFADIATAIATAYGSATTPSGLTAIQSSTYLLDENIGADLPRILVFPWLPPDWDYGPGQRFGVLDWPVRLFTSGAAPLKDRMADLYQWAQSLYYVFPVSTNIDLGLGSYVQWAVATLPSIRSFEYGGDTFPVVEVHVLTHLREPLP